MTAVLGGLGAAVCFACTALCAARAARSIGGTATAAWGAIAGLAVVAGPAAVALVDLRPSAGDVGLMLAAGGLNAVGLVAEFRALRHAAVSVVMPVVATEGAVAAIIAFALGEALGAAAIVALSVVVVGLFVTMTRGRVGGAPRAASDPAVGTRAALAMAGASAVAFGLGIYLQGRVGDRVSLPLAVLSAPLMGTLIIALPLAFGRRLPRPRGVVPAIVGVGVFEVAGFVSYTLGARDSIATAAVLMSQFGAVSVLLGFVVLHERLTPRHLVGLATITVGVGALAAVR